MIRHCGTVWGFRNCSYLYVILTDNHAYIGETGNLPTSRWGSHLYKAESSFLEKLKRDLEPDKKVATDYEGEIVYIGLHCECIDDEEIYKQKFARLAVEDEIHRQLYLKSNAFGSQKKILSKSSKRSSRISLSFDVESFAKYAISLLINEYSEYLKKKEHQKSQ